VLDRPVPTDARNARSSKFAFAESCWGSAFGGPAGAFRSPGFFLLILAVSALTEFPMHLFCSPHVVKSRGCNHPAAGRLASRAAISSGCRRSGS